MSEVMQVPKLRFKEFSDGWNSLKLGKLGFFKGGGTPSTTNENYWSGNIPWISSSDISENDVHNLNLTRYLTREAIEESAAKIIPKGSVLFVSRVGVGKLAVSVTELCTSQDFANLVLKSDNSYFIAYYFLSKNKLLHRYSQGTSIKGFTTGDLKSIPVNTPTIQEQQKIATFLTAVDKKISQQQEKKSLLEHYKKGIMQQLFSQQLRFKPALSIVEGDDDGKEFPDWEEKRLGDVAEIITGSTPSTFIPEYYGGNVNFVSPADIQGNRYVKDTRTKLTELGFSKSRKIKKGNVVFVCIGSTIGKVAQLVKDSATNQQINSLVTNSDNNSDFLFSILEYKGPKIKLLAGMQAVPQINKSDFSKIKITIPSLEEQTKIANFLSSIDDKIAHVNTQLENTQQFKKGLLQQMFV